MKNLIVALTLIALATQTFALEATMSNSSDVQAASTTVIVDDKPKASQLSLDYNLIHLDNPKLEKTLGEHYSAYNVTIFNNGPNTVELINADISNGVNGQMAYETSKRNTSGRAIGWWVFTGVIGGGISAARNSSRNKATRQASLGFEDKFPLGPMPAFQTIEVNTFVPLGTKPQVKVVYKDTKTGEVLFANK